MAEPPLVLTWPQETVIVLQLPAENSPLDR